MKGTSSCQRSLPHTKHLKNAELRLSQSNPTRTGKTCHENRSCSATSSKNPLRASVHGQGQPSLHHRAESNPPTATFSQRGLQSRNINCAEEGFHIHSPHVTPRRIATYNSHRYKEPRGGRKHLRELLSCQDQRKKTSLTTLFSTQNK